MGNVDVVRALATLSAAGVLALTLHVLVFRMVFRFGWKTWAAELTRQRVRWPARVSTGLVAALVASTLVGLEPTPGEVIQRALTIALILALAWTTLRGIHVIEDVALGRLDVTKEDNLRERRRLTQVRVLRRLASVVTVIVAGAGILMTFPTARSIGASVLASAGIVGVVAGVAGRSTLGNLVAGVQIAFTEPVRLDDVVIVEGEWGRIEEITLTYVVVAIWDQRRLVVPTTFFVEQTFQNWTRSQSQLIGQVIIWADWRVPVPELRRHLARLAEGNPLWDGRVCSLQVVDTNEQAVKLRALVSAKDAQNSWDLRCDIREGLVKWLAKRPEYLPTARLAQGVNDGQPQ